MHPFGNVEAQHADYVRVLSSHAATTAALQQTTAALEQTTAMALQLIATTMAEGAALRQDVAGISRRLELLEAFLRSKLGNGHDEG
jgi:hypothetical protein